MNACKEQTKNIAVSIFINPEESDPMEKASPVTSNIVIERRTEVMFENLFDVISVII